MKRNNVKNGNGDEFFESDDDDNNGDYGCSIFTSDSDSDDDDDESGEPPVKRRKNLEESSSSSESSIDDDSDSGSSSAESETCAICLGKLKNNKPVATPDVCDHTFHVNCIIEWSKNVNTCPIDRMVFSLILARDNLLATEANGIPIERRREHDGEDDDEEEMDVTRCQICQRSDGEDRLLLCDDCDDGYHLECLTPPLTRVPRGDWFCPECVVRRESMAAASADTSRASRIIARTLVTRRVLGELQRNGLLAHSSDEDDEDDEGEEEEDDEDEGEEEEDDEDEDDDEDDENEDDDVLQDLFNDNLSDDHNDVNEDEDDEDANVILLKFPKEPKTTSARKGKSNLAALKTGRKKTKGTSNRKRKKTGKRRKKKSRKRQKLLRDDDGNIIIQPSTSTKKSKKKSKRTKRKTKKRKAKNKAPLPVIGSRTRLARKLGIVPPLAGHFLPQMVKPSPLERFKASMCQGIVPHIFGCDPEYLPTVFVVFFLMFCYIDAKFMLALVKSAASSSSSSSSFDLLGDILKSQSVLHMRRGEVTIQRDGGDLFVIFEPGYCETAPGDLNH
ncbi:hypothetical protein HELRODRAFT_188679 [Helobdella robusta]|uniref:PHD-type domain-containing protein n=1 Tax=Helobdella robusta TaxID=6412 RepID=T1FQ88_HELRO|nr:hypothetical protein HELRODRAFT_188679 [Helobdella robusta]ESO02378.1 hypothetical protein HELRODRAFT_188679 [Helobdella robusta]